MNNQQTKETVLAYLESRFGLSQTLFSGFQFYSSAKGRIFLGPVLPQLPFLSAGLLIARISPVGTIKPTTAFLQLFGRHITKNKVELSREQALLYLSGESFPIETTEADGYVLLTCRQQPLGCALLKNGQVKNMLPKARRMDVRFL